MNNNNKPLQREGVLAKVIGDETMLYKPDAGSVHMLNYTAAFVWNLCNGSRLPKEIADILHDAYEVAGSPDLKSDVVEILDSFEKMGLLA